MAGISELEAIVAQLQGKGKESNDGFSTTAQLIVDTGLSNEKVLAMLRVLKAKGLLETRKIQAETITGAKYMLTAFRVKVTRNGRKSGKRAK